MLSQVIAPKNKVKNRAKITEAKVKKKKVITSVPIMEEPLPARARGLHGRLRREGGRRRVERRLRTEDVPIVPVERAPAITRPIMNYL